MLLVDLAVPRDIDAAVHELDGAFLYDIDDLEAVVAEEPQRPRREAARAEAIVAEQAERFRAWHASLDVVPAIASLRARAEEIRAASWRGSRAAPDLPEKPAQGDRGPHCANRQQAVAPSDH